MTENKTVLFICTGNTCRSPMAERLLIHAIKAEKDLVKSVQVISAGIAAGEGYPPSANSVEALEKVGIDLRDHSTRQATPEILKQADYIFGMTESHLDSAQHYADGGSIGTLHLMRDFIEDNIEPEIPDPFGLDLTEYEYARDSMVEAIPSIIQFLKNQFKASK